jgi:hypothetical protein
VVAFGQELVPRHRDDRARLTPLSALGPPSTRTAQRRRTGHRSAAEVPGSIPSRLAGPIVVTVRKDRGAPPRERRLDGDCFGPPGPAPPAGWHWERRQGPGSEPALASRKYIDTKMDGQPRVRSVPGDGPGYASARTRRPGTSNRPHVKTRSENDNSGVELRDHAGFGRRLPFRPRYWDVFVFCEPDLLLKSKSTEKGLK